MSAAVSRPRFAPGPMNDDFGLVLAQGFARRIGALARRLGGHPLAATWARRAAFAASRATGAGHVCVSLALLAHRYGETLEAAAAALKESGVVSDGSEDAAGLKPLVVDGDGRLYLARYYDDERRLARSVVAHAEGSGATSALETDPAALTARLERFFGPHGADEVDWQRAAAALALSSRLTVVSGGPGTGKTTTVVGMLACLLDAQPTLSIALAAPTGKAAQRMQEALLARASSLPETIAARLPRTSQTLHRLLGLGGLGRARYGPDNPLPHDVIVVDEASMIDVALAAQLFDALAPDTRLVLLGDKDQLAAVEAGAVFSELSARASFSEAGIARIARGTGVSAARVRAALPRPALQAQPFSDTQPLEPLPGGDDLFPLFDELEPMEAIDSIDGDWAWTGLDEPEVAHASDGVPMNTRTEARLDATADKQFFEARGAAPDEHAPSPPESRRANEPAEADPDRAPLVDRVVWLERNYRFGLDSAIGRLSLAIRGGDADAALAALGVSASPEPDLFGMFDAGTDERERTAAAVLDEDAGTSLSPRTLERLMRGFAPYVHALATALAQPEPDCGPLFDALNAFRILCATRLGARGVNALNAHMAEHVRQAARAPLLVGTNWFAGRAVMVARNDYALGLFNGDIGIALPTREGPLRVHFLTADGGMRAVSPAALPPHDTAFALTVHKSQGSEFDHAALVLPSGKSRSLARELVYTAITRARKAVRIVGSREVLAQAIATPTRRDSGLFARMREVR